MHTHLHRTPQPNTFPSFISKNTLRMVREPHRTHGNKTRISSFTDSRTTICALCYTPTPISTLSPLVFRCHFHTVVQNKHLPQRASPGHTRRGVTPGPLYVTSTPFTTQHRSHVQVSLVCRFHSLRPDFRLHPPSPAPRPHRPPASGRRVSAHLFPRAYLRVPVI